MSVLGPFPPFLVVPRVLLINEPERCRAHAARRAACGMNLKGLGEPQHNLRAKPAFQPSLTQTPNGLDQR
jgi:hypothetical protein